MKKIILPIFMSVISSSVLANDVSSTQLDMNKSVRFYAKALQQAVFTMHYKYNQSADGAEQASAISKEFLQTLDIKDGVVQISIAELIEKCMTVYQKSDADIKCSDAAIDAVHKHNILVKEFTPVQYLLTTDMNTKIKWSFRVWYSALSKILDLDSEPLVNTFADYMKSVSNIASLNEWLSECNRAMQYISSSNEPYLKDVISRLKSHDFTCQRYIENLVQTHNEFTKAYHTETVIE